MNIVLLQTQLPLQEIEHLLHEFPQYLFLSFTESTYKNLSQENWSQVEILYGSRMGEEELQRAHQLRWIHSPEQELNKLCIPAIEEKGNIIITAVKEENLHQVGEFVIGAILAFSKNFFHWQKADQHPNILWDSKWRESMWTLPGKKFLQIGLNKMGTEIAKRASELKMRVYGVDSRENFHPYCHKTFSYEHINSLLPDADIIAITLPKLGEHEGFLGEKELELMKEGSILVLIGNPKVIDEEALLAYSNKFRGILIDAMYQTPISSSSPLWKIQNLIITPDVSARPKTHESQAFAIFRYNLRQYIHSNFKDMRNTVNRTENLLL